MESCTRSIVNSFHESNCTTERVNYYIPEKREDLRLKLNGKKQGCLQQKTNILHNRICFRYYFMPNRKRGTKIKQETRKEGINIDIAAAIDIIISCQAAQCLLLLYWNTAAPNVILIILVEQNVLREIQNGNKQTVFSCCGNGARTSILVSRNIIFHLDLKHWLSSIYLTAFFLIILYRYLHL